MDFEITQPTPGESAEGVLSLGVAHGIEMQEGQPSFISRMKETWGNFIEGRKRAFFAQETEPLMDPITVNEALNTRLREIRANLKNIELKPHPEFSATTLAE